MSLTSVIVNGIRRAKAAAGDLIVPIILVRTEKTYLNGVNSEIKTNQTMQGFVEKYTNDEVDGASVRRDDFKITIFNDNADITITTSDRLIFDNLSLEVVKIDPQFVGPLKPLIMVQGRR